MRSRAHLYVDGLLGGYAFGIILNLCFAWWTERAERPDAFWIGVSMLGAFVLLVVRRVKRHSREDKELDQLQEKRWHETLEQRVLRWRGENMKQERGIEKE